MAAKIGVKQVGKFHATSMRFSPEANRMVEEMCAASAVRRRQIVENAVRRMHRQWLDGDVTLADLLGKAPRP